jgi:alkanesulfonate monooxygenase SsuD/methylene tetrahydromethanopterin reductase-like flavin-dependent oxidoreductase (luciferase family)
MKFGTFHLMERPFWKSEPQVVAEHLDQMRAADELGFDAVWLTEHHFSSVPYVPDVPGEYGISASPFALACAVSQITRRVRIGTAVKVLALEHPLRTAEDAALADLLSLGRLDFGVGFGYRQYEFDGFGCRSPGRTNSSGALRDHRRRVDESRVLVHRALPPHPEAVADPQALPAATSPSDASVWGPGRSSTSR